MVERAFPTEGTGAMGMVATVGLFIAVNAEVTFEVVLAIELFVAAGKGALVHHAHCWLSQNR